MRYFLLSILLLFAIINNSYGSADLPYTTTFNCPEWDQDDGSPSCDGLSLWGSWKTTNGNGAQITTGANYPSGDGGRGYRWWVGDGTNNNSANLRLGFNSPPSRVWIRWYQRWQSGFEGSSWYEHKNLWFQGNTGSRIVYQPSPGQIDLGQPSGSTYGSAEGWGVDFYDDGNGTYDGTETSDGTWNAFETLIDTNTGEWKVWINGTLVIDKTPGYADATAIDFVDLHVNVKTVSNGQDMYIDIDDVAVSTTGYIGPLGSGGSAPVRSNPSPTSILDSGTTSTTMSLDTDTTSTCKYSLIVDTAYADMPYTYGTTGGTSHSQSITGLTDGYKQDYYTRCDNTTAVNTSDFLITIEVETGNIIEAGSTSLIEAGNNLLIQ